jgi:methionyl-tRNA formyltransferase
VAIIFFGTPDFAVPSLKALAAAEEKVVLVVTQPDRLKGRGHMLSAPPVKELALSLGINVLQPEKIRSLEFYRELSVCAPEFIIVVAYGRILPKSILQLPVQGCINVHASLLPKYRGAAPIQWSLLKAEKMTGVTTMLMDEGLDTGDILLQSTLEIDENDNSATLFERLADLGAKTLIETLKGIRSGCVKPIPQAGDASLAAPQERGRKDRLAEKRGRTRFFCQGYESLAIRGMRPRAGADKDNQGARNSRQRRARKDRKGLRRHVGRWNIERSPACGRTSARGEEGHACRRIPCRAEIEGRS